MHNAAMRYSGGSWLFRNLSFRLEKGETCVLLGPNGTGKTSLMKCMLGSQSLEQGTMQRPATLAHVPQSLEPVFDFSVLDVVLMGATSQRSRRLFASPKRDDYERAHDALAQVGMDAFAQRSFGSLSGGERQLALLARAVATGSGLVLLDEPTAALDLGNEERVLAMLEILKCQGTTLFMSSHNPEHALRIADRVLLMFRDGSYIFDRTSNCLTDANLTRLYGVPLTVREYGDGDGLHATVARRTREVTA